MESIKESNHFNLNFSYNWISYSKFLEILLDCKSYFEKKKIVRKESCFSYKYFYTDRVDFISNGKFVKKFSTTQSHY